jgi:phospholipid/cholesterol/gamma-HCH transport system permease protein
MTGDGAVVGAERIGAALSASTGAVVLDLAAVSRMDTFGMAALGDAVRRCRREGREVRIAHVSPSTAALASFLRLDRVLAEETAPRIRRGGGLVLLAGDGILRLRDYLVTLLGMTADAYRHAFVDPFRGDAVKKEQFLRQMAEAGAGAVPIVVLINFMLGLILAFQMAYVFRDYGATSLIANIVGVSVTRELGPLLAAILVASRSGSAMAAEIGTMVVTEEVDALQMMALKPRRFLLVPRFAALALAVPALCVFADVAGILGGAFVGIFSCDIGAYTYYSKTVGALSVSDITSGLLKSFFFGNIVAVIGCLHGLRLRGGPEAVGRAATKAVVESIIAVVVFDAAFTAVVYYIF